MVAHELGVHTIRVATHCTEADVSKQHIEAARGLGMDVSGFLMMSHMTSPEALARKVGARGLRMILEELMLDLMFHLPNNKRVRDIEITRDMVERRDLSLCLLEKAG